MESEVALVDVDAVALAIGRLHRDVILLAVSPNVVGLGFFVYQPEDELAALGHIRPLRVRPVRDILRGQRHRSQGCGQRQAGQRGGGSDYGRQ